VRDSTALSCVKWHGINTAGVSGATIIRPLAAAGVYAVQ